ncbi:MAG: MoxR family ATPase [Clostridia bacterium]|nr:MoxR family ATPase [Clostridia bacterium]
MNEVKKAVSGKDTVLLWILTALLADGHVMLEDIPGVGKTTIALAFAKALDLDYGRMQFTPDVLPSDVTGYSVYDRETGQMEYRKGAVLCNLFLADELNRATSRTQSALLEAMEEGQVTVDGISHPIPKPFFLFATQNPTGAAGTQLLPDSQIDRFIVCLTVGYPDAEAEREMVRQRQSGNPLDTVRQVVSRDELVQMQKACAAVYCKDEVLEYIVRLIAATRKNDKLRRGASPRATLAVTSMAKAVAYMQGRDFIIPKDVERVFVRTVAHRIQLTQEAELRGNTADTVLQEILKRAIVPKI